MQNWTVWNRECTVQCRELDSVKKGKYSIVHGIGNVQHSVHKRIVWNKGCTAQCTEWDSMEQGIYSTVYRIRLYGIGNVQQQVDNWTV